MNNCSILHHFYSQKVWRSFMRW